jgi:hypothetical protein
MKTKKVKIIEVSDFNKLVTETYGRIYNFQQQDGCKGRSSEHITVPCEPEDYENTPIPEVINGDEMGVSFKSWLERDPKAPLNATEKEAKNCGYYWGFSEKDLKEWQENKSHINMFYERNFYPHVSMIINDLHAKGLIEEGDYVIEIDW